MLSFRAGLKKLIISFFPQDIPAKFVKRYLSKTQGNVILWVSDGKNWTVRYTCQMAAGQLKGKFKCGWRAFAQDNNLEVGDVCAFELIKGTQMSFKVVIFHVTQEHCPLPPGEASTEFFKLVLRH